MRRLVVLLIALPLLLPTAPAHAETSATQLIVVQDQGMKVVRIPTSGGEGTTLLDDGLVHSDIAVSPNGVWLAYTTAPGGTSQPRSLMMKRTDGTGEPVSLESTTKDVSSPAWAPGGQRISYTVNDGGPIICRAEVTAAGGGPCSVITNDGYDHTSWFSDWSLVADHSSLGEPAAPLFVVTSEGQAFTVPESGAGRLPAVSPDGGHIAYVGRDGSNGSEVLMLMTWDSMNPPQTRTLPTPAGQVFSAPSWTRDQSALYVLGTAPGGSTLYRISTAPGGGFTTVPTTGQPSAVATVAEDITPPTLTVAPLPPVTLLSYIYLGYRATDAVNLLSPYLGIELRESVGGGYQYLGTGGVDRPQRFRLRPGTSTCFEFFISDLAANTTPLTKRQCVSAPLDDVKLSRSKGWQQLADRAFYGSSAARGGYATTLTHVGYQNIRQLQIVAQACPTCGILDAYVGDQKVGSINTISNTVVNRKVYTLSFPVKTGTVKLRVAGHRLVVVDGLGFGK